MDTRYHLPEIPLEPVDIVNRRAAATGSVRYAQLTSGADYNGHWINVSFKPHAVSGPIWNAEYHWGERVVLGRGSLQSCLVAAKREYDRGAHGTTVHVSLSDECELPIEDQAKLCIETGYSAGAEPGRTEWWTGTHEAVVDALRWEKSFPHYGLIQIALKYEGTAVGWEAERERIFAERRKS